MQTPGQVLGVEGRTTRNGSTIFDVLWSDGQKYVTFEPEMAQKAMALVGQQVTADLETKRDGRYTNRYFNDVAPAGQLLGNATTPVIPGMQTGVLVPQAIPQAIPHVSQDAVEKRITQLAALKVASNIVGPLFAGAGPEALGEARDAMLDIAKGIFAEVMGAPAAPAPVPATPQEVAAAVPGVQVGVQAGAPEW